MIYTGATLERQLGWGGGVDIIHLISARERASFVFPRDATFPLNEDEENIEIRGKTKLTNSRGNSQVFCYLDTK